MPESRVLVCATDPGGAANLAPVAAELHEQGAEVFVVTASQLAGRFRAVESNITTEIGPEQAEILFQRTRPTAVIVGTTRYDSPDRRLPGLAQEHGVRSVAVLDERYLYRARFENECGEVEAWPDVITLIDEDSRAEAVAEGLPAERLRVTGSPALAVLVSEVSRLETQPPARPPVLIRAGDAPVLTFLSETLSGDYGSDPDIAGSIGPYIGFTEQTVLATLAETLADLRLVATLIDKRHPADETPAAPERTIGGVRVITVRDEPLWPLLWHSRAVIGMRSMALLEAALIGTPALSFQPGLSTGERCTAVRLGLVRRALSADGLRTWLKDLFEAEPGRPRRPQDATSFAPPDAARRIARIALERQG